ncbi:11132_t:CDS:2 [Diversispora eburnea]|uniref:11132_t:CDS:1 n=1 Tax=Diversispora eburnea TaxID=1213867 RepID=A0A9N9A0I3_9GLOM|nr:11132_t:CDS:2 [Diversispora eburnea]
MEVSNSVVTEPSSSFKKPRHRYMSVSFSLQNDAESSSANLVGLLDDSVISGESNDTDPFLLVSLRNQRRPPPRPKYVFLLYLIALLDLAIVCTCTIFLVHNENTERWHWKKAEWGLLILGFLRFFVVLGVASSVWIKEMRWVLAGACCLSSLYIIFKSNLNFQHKRQTQEYTLILLISSFFFSQIHWIANVIITSDARRRALFLRDSSIFFEEDNEIIIPGNETIIPGNDIVTSSSPSSYGATDNNENTFLN